MCVGYFAWQHENADLALVALFNRDEILDRPTAPSHFWEDQQDILGGRDLVAGGTWLCISKRGRAAFLTNFRAREEAPTPAEGSDGEPEPPRLGANESFRLGRPSRGELPVLFVRGDADPLQYLSSVPAEAYAGFNLLCVDLAQQRMAYLCNKGSGGAQLVTPGLHGVTNGHLDAHWPKVDEGKRQLRAVIDSGAFSSSSAGSAVPWEQLFSLLSADRLLETDPERLPQTGFGAEFEAAASGIFVQPINTAGGLFGTRSQTVLAVWRDGRVELRERYRDGEGWKEVQHRFTLQTGSAVADQSHTATSVSQHQGAVVTST